MIKKSFCIANWKMYLSYDESIEYMNTFMEFSLDSNKSTEIIFCPSYLSINDIAKYNFPSVISVGSQDMSIYGKGAYTGEVSIEDLETIGCKWCVIGHSERRTLFNESDDMINIKLKSIFNSNINPILCIGETLEEMNNGQTVDVLNKQITSAFKGINIDSNKTILIAYEPVWSIGTGISADLDTILTNINIIKNITENIIKNHCNIYMLYGGSVSKENAKSIISIDGVDGFLIGSASIKPESFYSIYKEFL